MSDSRSHKTENLHGSAVEIDRLTDVFRAVFNDEGIELHDALTAADIEGWDSRAHISLIFAIEEEFSITFTTRDLQQLGNVGDLVRVLEKRLAGSRVG